MNGKRKLQLALLQTELQWEDSEANLQNIGEWILKLDHTPNVIVLPEMFNTGFTMNAEAVAQTMDGEAVTWLKKISKTLGTAICGSVVIVENSNFFNRFLWAYDGKITAYYDKRHLFRMADEHYIFTSGKKRPQIFYEGWQIIPRVCYDLRFPVWNRSTTVDLQIYVANWPQARVDAWDKLLMARAIENQCYVVGVNRIGTDGKGISYTGHSIVIDPKGKPITTVANEAQGWIIAEIDLEAIEDFRKKFPVAMDSDRFEIDR